MKRLLPVFWVMYDKHRHCSIINHLKSKSYSRTRMIDPFHDKRCTVAIILVWCIIVLVIFSSMGVLHSNFFRFGPSSTLHFMSIPIDTFHEWFLLIIYCACDTMVKSFSHDALVPFFTTVIADSKCKELPYSKTTCLLIIELYYGFCHFSQVFKFFLSLTQLDFILVAALADMGMKIWSYRNYMNLKCQPNQPEDSSSLIEAH